MSRIGRLPVTIPSGVQVEIDGRQVTVQGPKGTLRHTVARLSIECAGIEHTRRWLGHKSLGSIYEYLKTGDDGERQTTMAAKA